MSGQTFAWIVAGVLCISWSVGYHLYRRARGRLQRILRRQATRWNGSVRPGGLLSLPQLEFQHKGAQFSLTLFSGSSTGESGSSPAMTSAQFTKRQVTEDVLTIQDRTAQSTVEATLGIIQRYNSGDSAFDDGFVVAAPEGQDNERVLKQAVRRELLDLRRHFPAGVSLRINEDRVELSVHELARSEADVERILQTAGRLQEQLG